MNKSKIIFQSTESIYGKHIQSKEWIEYSLAIKIKDSGKQPVQIAMTFLPPHPFVMNMPEKRLIKAEDLSAAFTKIAKYFRSFGFELK
ncbi:hypothetical protein JXJ21_07355 [candidate division KSB1 bacterium]|nr:hypothetical protein [candidate division KSB1 bacterium]